MSDIKSCPKCKGAGYTEYMPPDSRVMAAEPCDCTHADPAPCNISSYKLTKGQFVTDPEPVDDELIGCADDQLFGSADQWRVGLLQHQLVAARAEIETLEAERKTLRKRLGKEFDRGQASRNSLIAQQHEALKRVDALNDNMAGFNPEINETVQQAIAAHDAVMGKKGE